MCIQNGKGGQCGPSPGLKSRMGVMLVEIQWNQQYVARVLNEGDGMAGSTHSALGVGGSCVRIRFEFELEFELEPIPNKSIQ